MTIEEVQRVANPGRVKKKARKYKKHAAKNPAKKRIKLSKKQIAAGFGGKRRKVAAKTAKRRAGNPQPKRKVLLKAKRKVMHSKPKPRRKQRKYTKNPVPAIIPLGWMNPERRTMATKKKRKAGTAHKHHAKKRTYKAKRKSTANPARRHRRARRYGNPGADFLGNGTEAFGMLIGVTAQKFAKGVVAGFNINTSSSPWMAVGINLLVALAIGKATDMIPMTKGKPIGKGIALGALASAISDGVNVAMPGVLGLSGLRTYQNALFAEPENPVMRGIAPASVPVAAKGMGGVLQAAFGSSF